jgi:hypothetical protein
LAFGVWRLAFGVWRNFRELMNVNKKSYDNCKMNDFTEFGSSTRFASKRASVLVD